MKIVKTVDSFKDINDRTRIKKNYTCAQMVSYAPASRTTSILRM